MVLNLFKVVREKGEGSLKGEELELYRDRGGRRENLAEGRIFRGILGALLDSVGTRYWPYIYLVTIHAHDCSFVRENPWKIAMPILETFHVDVR